MPQKKGCMPWNKGLTEKTDPRIKKSSRKINFTDAQKEEIKDRYIKGFSVVEIGKSIGCSSHPIVDFLTGNGLRRNYSESRKIAAVKNIKKIEQYVFDGITFKVVDGYLNLLTGEITTESKIELTCKDCGKIFIRSVNCFKSSRFYNNGDIICVHCSHKRKFLKYDRRVKTSFQQKIICEMIGATLNHKINEIYVDMAIIKENIVIEYDGWIWHGDKKSQQDDRRRDEYLKDTGWKILRIKSNRKIPQIEEINKGLEVLRLGKKKYTEIVLDDWGKTKLFFEDKT
jgi:very-short-patch-repair endonuclease